MAPKLPAQKLPSRGCGAGEGAGLLLRQRPGWHHQEAGPGNPEAGSVREAPELLLLPCTAGFCRGRLLEAEWMGPT